jgi:hypothetical protein
MWDGDRPDRLLAGAAMSTSIPTENAPHWRWGRSGEKDKVAHFVEYAISIWEEAMTTLVGFGTFADLPEEQIHLIKALDENKVGDLLDHLQWIGEPSRPEQVSTSGSCCRWIQ